MTFNLNNKQNKKLLYIFIICMVIYLFSYASLLTVDDYYFRDDNVRLITGGSIGAFNRYLATYLSYFLSGTTFTVAFAPLSQIVCLVFISIAGIITAKLFNKKLKLTAVFPICILGLFPFFWENMSYTYDSIFMGLSVLLGVIPFLFINNKWQFFVVSVLSVLGVCTTYQLSISIYPIMVILLAIDFYFIKLDNKKALSVVIYSLFAFITALIIFKIFIYSVPENSYIYHENTRVTRMRFLMNLPFLSGRYFIKESLLFIFVGLIYLMFVTGFIKSSKRNRLLAFIVAIGSVGVTLVLSLILKIMYVPGGGQARYFISYDFLIMALGVYGFSLFAKNKLMKRVGVVIYSIGIIHLSFMTSAYGNTTKLQWEYDKFRISMVATDLSNLIGKKENYQIDFGKGKIQAKTINTKYSKKT